MLKTNYKIWARKSYRQWREQVKKLRLQNEVEIETMSLFSIAKQLR